MHERGVGGKPGLDGFVVRLFPIFLEFLKRLDVVADSATSASRRRFKGLMLPCYQFCYKTALKGYKVPWRGIVDVLAPYGPRIMPVRGYAHGCVRHDARTRNTTINTTT